MPSIDIHFNVFVAFFWGGDYRAGLLGAIVVDERRGIDKGCVSGLAGLVPSVYMIHEMIHNRRRISVNIFGCGGRWARRAFAGSKFREREIPELHEMA